MSSPLTLENIYASIAKTNEAQQKILDAVIPLGSVALVPFVQRVRIHFDESIKCALQAIRELVPLIPSFFILLVNLLTCGLFKKVSTITKLTADAGTKPIAYIFAAIMAPFQPLISYFFRDDDEVCFFNGQVKPAAIKEVFYQDALTNLIHEGKPYLFKETLFYSLAQKVVDKTARAQTSYAKAGGKWDTNRILFHLIARVAYIAYTLLTLITRTLDFIVGLVGIALSLTMGFAGLFINNTSFTIAKSTTIRFTLKHLSILALPFDILRGITLFLNPTSYTLC